MKRYIIIIGIVSVCSVFMIDRYFFMENRLNNIWMFNSGRNFGEPLSINQNFILKNNRIQFINFFDKENFPKTYKNTQSSFYLLGSYFGNLYIWDIERKEITVYSKK
jgi:hypothetical protein